ncbi:MAG: hypothetical protein P8J33_03375 [Pirellulaceae bacterium]|nr:hypothetical protein [Pirellulaceae bacterium]
MSAMRQLLQNIVDYAGLFPPAGLPMPAVVQNYRDYTLHENSWMLSRLIVPAAKLSTLTSVYQETSGAKANGNKWLISALIPAVDAADSAFSLALEAIEQFNQTSDFAEVDTVEGKSPRTELIEPTCTQLPNSLFAFLEVPYQDPDEILGQIAAQGRDRTFAKIRTGGVTANLIPEAERVANFIVQCAANNLGFKATAGLHHPLPAEFALTYEPDSPRAVMHGFMNVFLAACFAKQKNWTQEPLTALLACRDPAEFVITEQQIQFQGATLTASDLALVRKEFAISFGSCSFVEPLEDLTSLDWLATAAKTV